MKIYEYFISVHVVCLAAAIFSNTTIETSRLIDSRLRIRELEGKMKEQFGHDVKILFFSLLNTKEIKNNLSNTDDN